MKQINPIEQGKRIRELRETTCLSRRAFCRKHHLPLGTLQNWEDGKYKDGIADEHITKLCKIFLSEGIHCTYEWFKHGTNHEPATLTLEQREKNNKIIQETMKNKDKIELNEQLYYAVIDNRQAEVIKLLKLGADLHKQSNEYLHIYNNDENSLLHIAANSGNLDLVKLLINEGAVITAKNRRQETPLHHAVLKGHNEIIKYLINYGADINAPEIEGDSPLMWAVYTGQTEVFVLLMNFHADINCRNHLGNTPLHWACFKGFYDIVEKLIHYGSDSKAKNKNGDTPLDIAIRHGHVEIVEHLLSLS